MAKKVYLVGAGPGDLGLITVKALDLLKKADTIIYDRLANEEILKFAKKDAKLVYVGKKKGHHIFRQERINEILKNEADEKKVVVRLKGGDPLVFGRGGEEMNALKENGIDFEVVPGVTSAIAVPGLANIPLTDRRFASSFSVVTGHEDPAKSEPKVDISRLNTDTVVILMGVGNLENIVSQALKTRSRETPVAIIQEGATENQKVVVGTLEDIVSKARDDGVEPPAIIVVGDVVRVRGEIGGPS